MLETANNKVGIGEEELQKAIRDYIEDSSDSLKGVLDKALYRKRHGQFDNFRIVIEGLAKLPQEGGTKGDIYDAIRLYHHKYPQSNLVHCLKELQSEDRGEFVRYDQNSGRYSFSNPFYRAYALAYLNKDRTSTKKLIKTDTSYSITLKAENIAKIIDAMLSVQNRREEDAN